MHFAVTRPMVPPTRTIRAGSDVSNGLCLFHYLCLRRAPTGTRQRQRNEVFLWGSRVFFDRLIRRGPTRKRSKSKTKTHGSDSMRNIQRRLHFIIVARFPWTKSLPAFSKTLPVSSASRFPDALNDPVASANLWTRRGAWSRLMAD